MELASERELAERLRVAMTKLPPRQCEVFCLRYFEDLGYDEIARALGISATAVSTALGKARDNLAGMLGRVTEGG